MDKNLEIMDLVETREKDRDLKTTPRSPRIHVVRDAEKFASLRDEWNRLVECSSATIFQTFEWLFLWWKHFGVDRDRALHILLVSRGSSLVGIFPLFLETKHLFSFRTSSRLRFLGSGVPSDYADGMFVKYGPSDFLDVIVHPDHRKEVVDEFLDYLQAHPSLYDEVELVNVPEGSVVKEELIPELEHRKIPYTIKQTDVCPRFHPGASIDEFLRTLGSNARRRFQQARKIFSGGNSHVIENITSHSEVERAFEDLVRFHQTRWNRIGYPGLFADKRFERFQRDVLDALGKSLWFKMAKIGDVRVAGRLGFAFNGRLYDYLSGFDDASQWSKHRPGLVLLLSMIEDAIERQYRSVEFLRGDEPYKFDLTTDYGNNWVVVARNPARRSGIRAAACRIVTLLEKVRHRLVYERLLLSIQRQQHPFPAYLSTWMMFRFGNLLKKILPVGVKKTNRIEKDVKKGGS